MDDSRLTLSDYQVLHELGSGSYGSAHLALHVPSDTKHVIKRIKISHMTPREVENARREVQVLSSLSHPYITQFRGSCEEDGFLLIAMDYCAGGDLHSLIMKRNGILFPEDRVLDWFVQLCLAIKYIHDRKILHRDIKSQNVFLTDDGKVRLGDFGIAKILSSSSELARTCIGTPYYLSPEMCENKPYNNKSDIWALGCVLYEMLTLRHAFEANNMKALILKIIKGIYTPVASRYSRDLRLLISQVFQREPQARPSICAVLRKAFIFKRVSKFISGCEEEELRESLVRRKYHLPASARRVVVIKRPPDITEPGAKYGVSLNRKLTHRSLTKPVSRVAKQAIPSGKKVIKVPPKNTGKLRQDSRKRCPSEDILSSKDSHKLEADMNNRHQRRSKSVPDAFKQKNLKPDHQYNKNKIRSPVKLKLMLDSAGLRRGKKDDNVDDLRLDSRLDSRESCESPMSPGWLVDEFLTKKLKAAYDKRKLVEALMSDKTCAKESTVSDGVARCVSPYEGAAASCAAKPIVCASEEIMPLPDVEHEGNETSTSAEIMPVPDAEPEWNKESTVCKPERRLGGDAQLPNPKDAKELANQSLKLQDSHCSEDEEGHDGEEALSGVSSEQIRQVMHEKMKKLFKERTKKMSQMVSERRQWAYEREKLCSTSVPQNNEEEIMKSTDSICNATDKDRKIHHISKKGNGLHKTTNHHAPPNVSYYSHAHENEDHLHSQEAPVSSISDKNSVYVEEDCMVHEARKEEVLMNIMEENKFKATDCQKNVSFSPQAKCDKQLTRSKSDVIQSDITDTKNLDPVENKYFGKVSQQGIESENNSTGNGVAELLLAQSSQGTTNEVAGQESASVSEDLEKSYHLTPSMRARWGAVRTADLEKSPLETTASEMDTTGASDCVVVYREAGERKQWKKECSDILNLLAGAQIIEESRRVQCETEEHKSLRDVEDLNEEESLKQQHKPTLMSSTFTLREGLNDCEGASCICKSQINTRNIVHKPSAVLNDTFRIEKSCFEDEIKLIGPPLLNSTFDLSKLHADQIICIPVPVLNSTYDIDKKVSVASDTVHQTSCEGEYRNTNAIDTVILKGSKEGRESLQVTYTISHNSIESENVAPKEAASSAVREETIISNEKVLSEDVKTNTKGGLLEKLRLHVTPQLKFRYKKFDSNIKLPRSPLACEVKASSFSVDLETDPPKEMHTPLVKKKGSMKLGLSGILRRLSSKNITNALTRSRSEERVEKDLHSFANSDRALSDSDSSQQESMTVCGTVKFINSADFKKACPKTTKDTSDCEKKYIFSSKALESSDNSVGFTTDNQTSTMGVSAGDPNFTRRAMCTEKTDSACDTSKGNEQSEEETQSNQLSRNSAFPLLLKNFDEVSTDSGIDSQKTSMCQMSSTDCSNFQILYIKSEELINEPESAELQKTSSEGHNWPACYNLSEAVSLKTLVERPLIEREKSVSITTQKLASSCTQNFEMIKTTLSNDICKEEFEDISPVSTNGVHINLMLSGEQKDGELQHKCENSDLICSHVKQTQHKLVTTRETTIQPFKVKQDLQSVQNRITTSDEVSNSQCRQNSSSQSSSEQPVIPSHSPARARPTLLEIGVKTTDFLPVPQDFASGNDSIRDRKCKKSKVSTPGNLKEIGSGSREHVERITQSKLCGDMYSEPATSPKDMKLQTNELFFSSDEESEDLANLRQSMESLLRCGEQKKEESKRQHSEFWHIDQEGGVVPGGGGVYGWIEEQREKLEDALSLDLFKKAYHLLEEAQEREGCVVGESVSQVECLLGPCHHHLAYDILQLVVAEAVYHN